MGKVIRGGELKPSRSASAIEIGGRTLEEVIAREESKDMEETLVPDKVIKYSKVKARHASHKEPNGPGRVFSVVEINAEKWESIMETMSTVEGVIVASLLSGKEVTGIQLRENCLKQVSGADKKSYLIKSSYIFSKTPFGKLITKRREGKGTAYRLVPAALDCRVDELMVFVGGGSSKARNTVLDHHKALRPYLEESETKTSETPKLKEPIPDISNAIGTAISKALGVNVSVQGKIEIVFKWE